MRYNLDLRQPLPSARLSEPCGRGRNIRADEDPKHAPVHALQNDLARMALLLERLDGLLCA